MELVYLLVSIFFFLLTFQACAVNLCHHIALVHRGSPSTYHTMNSVWFSGFTVMLVHSTLNFIKFLGFLIY